MKLVAVVLLLAIALVLGESENKIIEDFVKASGKCFKELNVPLSYAPKFSNFDFPDEPIVHRYQQCVSLDLGVWSDKDGYNAEHIADMYKHRAKPEAIISMVNECNQSTQNDSPLKWLHRGFNCMLDTEVGEMFRSDIVKFISSS